MYSVLNNIQRKRTQIGKHLSIQSHSSTQDNDEDLDLVEAPEHFIIVFDDVIYDKQQI